LKWWRVGGSNP